MGMPSLNSGGVGGIHRVNPANMGGVLVVVVGFVGCDRDVVVVVVV
jgi:hypothetical protein